MQFLERVIYNNTIQDWAISILIIVVATVVARLFLLLIKITLKALTKKTKTRLDDILIDMLEEPAAVVIALYGIWFALHRLAFTDSVNVWITKSFWFAVIIAATWFVARLTMSIINEYLKPAVEKSEGDLDDQLLPIAKTVVRWIIWIIGFCFALWYAGANLAAILTGVGIGGIALAMAAKDSIANIIGGITIFSDKPFVLHDLIEIGDHKGYIREVGIRSTRLETFDGTVVTIPNMQFIENSIENITLEPSRRITLDLGLTYDTHEDKVLLAMDILKDIIAKTNGVEKKVITSFNAFGDFSLGIFFAYYISKGENIFQIQSDVNLQILKRFNAEKLDFAFPTQSIIAQIDKAAF